MTQKQKYQFIVSIHSDKDLKAESIYNELKRYVFGKYSRRVTFNKLYKIIDMEKEREERKRKRKLLKVDKINDSKFMNED